MLFQVERSYDPIYAASKGAIYHLLVIIKWKYVKIKSLVVQVLLIIQKCIKVLQEIKKLKFKSK